MKFEIYYGLIVHWENGNRKRKTLQNWQSRVKITSPSETTPYLLSLPQQIQIRDTIIDATNTPPNVNKNIPNEVRRAAVGESRLCAGSVVESIICVVGVTTVVMLTNERVGYLVRSGWILGWFGEIGLLPILALTELAHLKHHGLLDEWLVLVVSPKDPEIEVVEGLEWSPVIQE